MSGIVGGCFSGSDPRELVDELAHATPSSLWYHEYGEFGLGISYYTIDPQGFATWTDGVRAGVIHGAVTNLDELGWSIENVFERLFRRPADTAAALEGGFVIACQDPTADHHLVVTDKLGTRPVYYTGSEPFRYASAVDVLLQVSDERSVNVQAVSDMLLMGHLWGNHTLVKGILSQRPATVVEVTGSGRSFTRYWKPDYTEELPNRRYLDELVSRYRQAVKRTSKTLPARAGIWLSGGIDSRTATSSLLQHRQPTGFNSLNAYTYDANPPTSDNPKIARQVAKALDIEHEEVPLTAGTVGENFGRIVEATGGMVSWTVAKNLSATYEIDSPPPVLMEGMEGTLLGDHLYRYHLSEFSSAVDSQLSSEATTDPEHVTTLLTESVEPLETFRAEARRSPESTTRETVLDVHFQNYYNRLAMPSNRLMRDRVGTRVLYADSDYLEWCAKLPRRYRKGAFRFGGVLGSRVDKIPHEPTRAKLALVRRIDPDLAEITYERSKVKPSWPYPLHVLGFVGNVIVNRLRSNPTYGTGQQADFWIRDTETSVHEEVTRLLDDACSRELFDTDAVRDEYDKHMDGKNNASMLGRITTLEYWLQTHID